MKKQKEVIKKEVIKKEKKVVVPKYELVSFGIKATIPTQMYGNIMPEIVVKAKTIEDAKAVVMPAIEAIYGTYCEKPRDGSIPVFMSKAKVTAEERVVPVPPAQKVVPVEVPGKQTTTPPAPQPTAQASADALADELNPKSAAYEKAFGAIKNSMSLDALGLIEDQIQKSVKLTADEKPVLLTEVLKKRKEFQ